MEVNATNADPCTITLSAGHVNPSVQLNAIITSFPEHGKLSPVDQNSGNITYTSDKGYEGKDSFSFKVTDGQSESNISKVEIIVKESLDVTGEDRQLSKNILPQIPPDTNGLFF
jgi:hypothetical protein